ncbi:hypothetical protein [Geitlerinema sp. PCC 9228]|nr:hypothetical protein [Geitlerinema sp. PCC 9228]
MVKMVASFYGTLFVPRSPRRILSMGWISLEKSDRACLENLEMI